jgi:ATP-dependent RNA helicase DDX27
MEDDFILTISDHDSLPISDVESEDSEVPVPENNLGKRKRVAEPTKRTKKKFKKQKVTSAEPEVSAPEEEEQGRQDGAIDPDFEFDIGGNALNGAVEDFDGWEERSGTQKVGNKKGVDIDEIIARRANRNATKKTKTKTRKPKEDEFEGLDDEEVEDGGSVDLDYLPRSDDMPNFEDDELLAEDAFGGAAGSEEEGADEDEESNEIPPTNGSQASESDDNSVASPTAHPDDFASDQGDDDDDSQTSISDPAEQAKRDAFFAPDTDSKSKQTHSQGTGFSQFSLSRPLLRALSSLNFSDPTPIQLRTIPLALQGLDLVASAVTGSGKTAAFLLPILERLLYRPRRIPTTRVAILMPTRELAVQCYSVAVALSRYTDITFAQLVGGFSLREQENILKKRPDVVIATPGRFIDHMRNSASFSVGTLEILVLDEADRMLDDGFADELNEILRTIPRSRQTLLFSATMTESIDKLVRVGMNRPLRISVDTAKSTTTGLVQEFIRLRPGRDTASIRLATLILLCQTIPQYSSRTIIFFRQKASAHRVRIIFSLMGLKAGELHGSMSQDQRIAAVMSFKNGHTSYLLATDLASRGLDIKNVAAVINYEAPQSHEIYVHRVGRTARAGREGRACTLAAEPDRKVVKAAVKSARSQKAKVVSRVLEIKEVDSMASKLEGMEDEIDEILKEEKEEKQLASASMELTRGENLVKHEDEIMSRPKRTWFESEKEKRIARKTGRVELNGPEIKVGKKGKLSNKDKKALDDRRERVEGKLWRKGKGSEESSKQDRREKKGKKSGGIKKMKKGGKR